MDVTGWAGARGKAGAAAVSSAEVTAAFVASAPTAGRKDQRASLILPYRCVIRDNPEIAPRQAKRA